MKFARSGQVRGGVAVMGGALATARGGLWPTPRASARENRQLRPTPSQLAGTHGMSLAVAVNLWPTPTANQRSGLQSHGNNAVLGPLNPRWVEWLMGFPLDWTDAGA